MSITEGTQPASLAWTGAWTTAQTTASFTPDANSLLVALVAGDGANTGNITASITDSLSGSWTLLKRQNTSIPNAGGVGGTAEVWCRDIGGSPASMTVSVTGSGAAMSTGGQLTIRTLLGAVNTAGQNGATGGASIAQPAAAIQISVAAGTGNKIYGAAFNYDNSTVMTVLGNTTAITQTSDATNGDTWETFKSSADTAGTATYGFSTSHVGMIAAVEIKAGTTAGAVTFRANPGETWKRRYHHPQRFISPGVAGPQALTSSINATVGFTSSDSQLIGNHQAATVSITSSQTRKISTLRSATVSFTGSLASAAVHHFTQALNATLSFTGSQLRRIGNSQAATLSFTGSQSRSLAKVLAATVSFTGSATKRMTTTESATLSFTGSVVRRTATIRSATVSFTGTLASAAVHHFTQALNATMGFTGSLATAAVHFFTQALSATLSFTSSQSRSLARALAATLSFTGTATKRTSTPRNATLSFTSSDTEAIRVNDSATVGFTSSQSRKISTLRSATLSFTGSLATQAVHFFTQALNATLSFTGTRTATHIFTKALSATLSFTGSQTRRVGHLTVAGLSYTGSQLRRVGTKLNAVLGFLGSVVGIPFGSTQPKPPFKMSSSDAPVGRMNAFTSGGASATDAARASLNASTRDVGDLVANDSSSALTTKVTP